MRKLIGRLLVVLALGWAGSASATLLPPVTVNGQEWLQLVDFVGISWDDINAVCNAAAGGLCNGSLGGNDMTGWTWANIDEVNALFNYFLSGSGTVLGPGPDSYFVDYISPFVINITGVFTGTSVGGYNGGGGWTRDSSDEFTSGQYVEAGIAGYGYYQTGTGFASTMVTTYLGPVQMPDVGAWFYAAPTPATLPLIGIALAALGYSRRKIKISA